MNQATDDDRLETSCVKDLFEASSHFNETTVNFEVVKYNYGHRTVISMDFAYLHGVIGRLWREILRSCFDV
jgi:hypothetical protein